MIAQAPSFSIRTEKCRHLVFAKFRELQSARGVMRFLRANSLPLPVRPLHGPSPHEVIWREADSARVRNILHNPTKTIADWMEANMAEVRGEGSCSPLSTSRAAWKISWT